VARGYARYVLVVMVGINFLNYMDRWVAAAAAPLVQKEFHLSDALIGLLGSAFLIVYAVAALPFGYWADRGVRKTVIGVGVAIWSIATLFTGFARNFAQLFLSRAVLGIGEASYYPAGTSLLSDYFPKEQRGRVMSIWGAGSTLGIAAFPNGETFRIGNPEPTVYVARIFLRQHIFLDKDHFEEIGDGKNQVKERVSTTRLTLTAGKFSIGDFFDNSNVSHDPRSDFMNWALMNNGAYDYAANTRGYTYGFTAEYVKPGWTLRLATSLEPSYANGPELDWHYTHTNSENLEFEKRYALHGHKGTVRLLSFLNVNKAPNYNDVVAAKLNGTDTSMDVLYGKKYGSKKLGFGLNAEQELNSAVNAFLRVGWNDGRTASWPSELSPATAIGTTPSTAIELVIEP